MMQKKPERIWIKPATIDIGRGPQLSTVPYPSAAGARTRVLAPEGDEVLFEGTARSYWQRRLNEGSVLLSKPPKPEASKPASLEKDKT